MLFKPWFLFFIFYFSVCNAEHIMDYLVVEKVQDSIIDKMEKNKYETLLSDQKIKIRCDKGEKEEFTSDFARKVIEISYLSYVYRAYFPKRTSIIENIETYELSSIKDRLILIFWYVKYLGPSRRLTILYQNFNEIHTITTLDLGYNDVESSATYKYFFTKNDNKYYLYFGLHGVDNAYNYFNIHKILNISDMIVNEDNKAEKEFNFYYTRSDESQGYTCTFNNQNINFRRYHDLNSSIITILSGNEQFRILEIYPIPQEINSEKGYWAKIELSPIGIVPNIGWIWCNFIRQN